MRFIIRELPYEKPLAAGSLRYEFEGRATGAVEKWRLTSAVSGYRFLRVDLDAREAESGHSHLYHLVLDENGRPERLSYRFWGAGLQVSGNVLLENETLTATRRVNGDRHEDLIDFQSHCAFWFPSSVGLGLLANCAQGSEPPGDGSVTAVTLAVTFDNGRIAAEAAFALVSAEVHLTMGLPEQIPLMGEAVTVRPLAISWQDQERTIWLDAHNWPIKMRRGDGLTATETRYVRYT